MLEKNWESANEEESVDIELILINDFPSEKLKIEKQWIRNISCIVIGNTNNYGIHFSRVQGFVKSKGEYILFLDQDDEISPIYIREQLRELNGYDAIICNGKNYSELIYKNEIERSRAVNPDEYRRGFNRIVSPGQVLLRRKVVPIEWTVNILRNNGADDYFMWLLFFQKKYRIGVHKKVLYWHMISDENASKNMIGMYRSVCEMIEKMKKLNYMSEREANEIKKIQSVPENKNSVSYNIYQKEKHYRQILELWMKLRDKKISIAGFLKKKNIKKIAIYGGGILGRHLYYELQENGIHVECIIDRDINVKIQKIRTVIPGGQIRPVDAIIITPFIEYEQIKEKLKKYYSYNIFSIEFILFNADCELMTE